ncbi:MAG TPA: hypothetical protein VLX59_14575 [Acidimicrobiales bacterium]|nr:hypothetical protein [Acidimicrobiales bacterium]
MVRIPRRAYTVLQAGVGAVLLAAPWLPAAAVSGPERLPPLSLVRLLGARLLIQAGVAVARPTETVITYETAVEAVHGTSMLLAAYLLPRNRRTALGAAGVAAGLVLSGLWARRP